MRSRRTWFRLLAVLATFGAGLGTAAMAVGIGDANTPAVQLHLDTFASTAYAPDGTSPMGTTPDSSGNGLNAHGSGVPISDGRFQGAMNLLYNDNGLTVPDNTTLRPAQVTVMAWVRRSSSPGTNRLILGKPIPANQCGGTSYGLTTGTNGGVQFNVTADHGATFGGIYESSTPEASSGTIWNGQWHAVAGTYDGSTMRLWVDGVLAQSAAFGSNVPLAYDTADPGLTDLYAGQATSSSGCDQSQFRYGGNIDEIRVYDRALSQSEIQILQDPAATTPPVLTTSTSSTTSSSTSSTSSTITTSTGSVPTSTTTGSASSTTVTTGTAPRAAASPPVASFTVPARPVARYGQVILNASGTSGAVKLLWDIGGDGRTDLIRPPSQPVLAIRLPLPATVPVRLTAIAANGSSSTTLHTVTIGGVAPPTGLLHQIRPVATAVSAASPAYFAGVGSCSASQQTLTFGLAETVGCFDRINDVTKVPLLERQIVHDHYDSEVANSLVGVLCRQAQLGKTPQSVCDHARMVFPPTALDVYVSKHAVKLNGITITPVGPASVVVYPSLQRVISSFAIVKWGGFPVSVGPVDFDLHNQTVRVTGHAKPTEHPFPPEGRAVLLSFNLSNLPDIAGFRPEGSVQLALQAVAGQYGSTGSLNLSLPSDFSVFGGKPPSAGVTLAATNSNNGPVLDNLDLQVPEANLGAVDLTNVRFRYARNGGIDNDFNPGTSCGHNEWKAQANIFIIGKPNGPDQGNAGFLLSPPPSQNGVGFCDGSFKNAGAELVFGNAIPRPEIFPGVFLNNINFAVQLNPTLLRGGAALSAADLTNISGTLLAVFAHPWQPYRLSPQDAGTDLQDLAGRTFTSTSFAIGGAVGIHVPGVGNLNIFHGGAVYSYPDYIGVAARVDVQLGIYVFNGTLGGQFDLHRGLFEVDAGAHICIRGFKIACAGGLLVASEKGAVACVQLGPLNPGVGVMFNGHVDVWIPDGCKPSRYWSAGRSTFGTARAAGTAQAPIRFTIVKGETVKSLKVGGQGGAPHVIVRGPGGQSLTVPGDGAVWHGALEGLSASKYSTTWLGVKQGRPGHYTITTLPGSAPITSFADSRPGYDTNFGARVTGHGDHLLLHYDARKRGGGQKVTFFEDGPSVMHPLVTSTGGTGTVRFTPAAGAGGPRTIVARATVQGSPIRSQTLARFRFTGTQRTVPPARVHVRRRGTRLTVDWTTAPGASRYGIVVRLSGGSVRIFRASAGRRTLRVSGVALDQGGSVGVSTEGQLGDWSRPRSASFKRLRQPFTVLQTNRHNERHHYKKKHTKSK